ncbi:CMP-N-acetylneuraminate-beta-galactosamide-alpha-2,3-sialyltransferase 1-like [Polyodon spathula]|uniref:CMP-N-acetylneuraminate-beta-galactosamide- alpha-2,3-sialyltransferase 1-like n=1 Tax=Polyodon spathula TaxID=7913 RepID=UPI001B7F15FA|nr:CMP-N-acetylneuraminate-beta-galactosamide-alpha-2,3-sialyltransferase 1-like [Polyodon spathula]XP_041102424.1 CMP-N-acetylneuraminate-beta-galactosamide-alpha-2,3-sialyltransferase 1-like [Polyodon spathula]XP_041102425.1 CMP-N-acetylneuraminate-beta-galactosamide-alpha-2,3-sialyltransferase 1-like [Polyodon spathula]XP_041102426.1 CMP-N-acetylneuraminate-beta-galactosamide-alpha-2,3-sialyltransferase 1-like [Polyodon spathula]
MLRMMQRKQKVLTLLCIVLTLTTVVLRYSYHESSSMYYLNILHGWSDRALSNKPCACEHCVSEAHTSPWFDERFNHSIRPLMSENTVLSEDTYIWWQMLQQEQDPANFTVVMKELFKIIPSKEMYLDWGAPRCRKCAVVGNSGNLKGSSYGSQIDLNDFVFRMNQAPTAGHEKDVGRRTTHHLMYPESAKHLQPSTSLVLIPFKILDLQWLVSALTTGNITQTYTQVLSTITASKDKILIFNPTFFKYISNNWLENRGRYPSTGLLTLVFAIHICDEVNVYGFGANSEGKWHHYWEDIEGGAFRQTGVHDGDYEYNITRILADIGKINFFKGR